MVVLLKEYSVFELVEVIKRAHPLYLIAGILLMFLFIGCQAINFNLILSKMGCKVSLLRCIQYAYVGYYFGAITPGASGGQPAQVYYMSKDKIHIDLSAITIFYMVFVSQIVILFLGGVFACVRVPIIAGLTNWMKYLLVAGSMVMLSLIIILIALMFSQKTVPYLMNLGFKLGVKWRLIKKVDEKKAKMDATISSYKEKSKMILKYPDLFFQVFAVTILQWIFYYLVSFMVYRSFGHYDQSSLDLMTRQSIISISVAAVPLPGSVGVAEKEFLTIFQSCYTPQELPSAMLLSRIINFYMPLFISFVVYMFVHFRVVKMKRKN
jgi:conserved hypothetical protein